LKVEEIAKTEEEKHEKIIKDMEPLVEEAEDYAKEVADLKPKVTKRILEDFEGLEREAEEDKENAE